MKRVLQISTVIGGLLVSCQTFSQSLYINDVQSLKRFNSDAVLSQKSELNIRDVHVGDNVLSTAIKLADNGGKIHYISGGNRSRQVKISFFQPYLESQLEQRLELNFNQNNGFIHKIELTYLIESAYLDIKPVYQKVIDQAVTRYGEPVSFESVKTISKSNNNKPRLTDFLRNASFSKSYAAQIEAFFREKIVTSKTHFVSSENGRALLLTGFKQCLIWQRADFEEVLTLCAFQPKSGNMKGQGISLTLINFNVEDQIENYREEDADGVDIKF